MRTITNTSTGRQIPVSVDLKIQPLILEGKTIRNGNGRIMMNDEWIYVPSNTGQVAMNVNRAMYCEKMYLAATTIRESIGPNTTMDNELTEFSKTVADTLAFEKNGKWYRLYLSRLDDTFSISKVIPYTSVYRPNIWNNNINNWAHKLSIDWKTLLKNKP